jgi:PA14 domain
MSKLTAGRPATLPRKVAAFIRAHEVECLLFVLLWTTYAYFYPASQHNSGARFAQMRTIWEAGSLDVTPYGYMSGDLVTFTTGGTSVIYPNKAPGTTFLGLLPFGLYSAVLRPLVSQESVRWAVVAYLTTVTTIGLLSAAAGVATFVLLRRATGNPGASVLAVVAIWLGTIVFPYSVLYMSHQHAAAQLAIAFVLAFRIRHGHAPLSSRSLAVCGLLLGLTLSTEYPTALLVGPLLAYAAWAAWRATKVRLVGQRAVATLLLWTALGLLPWLVYNVLAFGTPAHIAYHEHAAPSAAGGMLHEHALGFMGVHWPGTVRFFDILARITVLSQRGLLYIELQGGRLYACCPVLWLAIPGLYLLFRQTRLRLEAAMITTMVVAYLTFNACYGESIIFWGGGTSIGPRHLIPMLPFLALPLCLAARRLPWLFLPLLAVSVFYMLIATAVEPRVPYIYENPARDMYLPRYLEGWFGHGRAGLFVEDDIRAGRDAAFNLAELAGMPGRWHLVPLLAWWVWIGHLLLRRIWPRPATSVPHGADVPARSVSARRRKGVAPARGLQPAWGTLTLIAFAATVGLAPVVNGLTAPRGDDTRGLTGHYFSNRAWLGSPTKVRTDPEIDFDWWGKPPLLPPFSVEWKGTILIDRAGAYLFHAETKDAVKLEIGGRTVFQLPSYEGVVTSVGSVDLSRGRHPITIRYTNQNGDARLRLSWTPPEGTTEIVPAGVFGPAPPPAI